MADGSIYTEYQPVADNVTGRPEPKQVGGNRIEVKLARGGVEHTESVPGLFEDAIPAWGHSVETAHTTSFDETRLYEAAAAIANRTYFEASMRAFAALVTPGGDDRAIAQRRSEIVNTIFGVGRIAAGEIPTGATVAQLNQAEADVQSFLHNGPDPAVGSLGEFFLQRMTSVLQAVENRNWAGPGDEPPNQVSYADLSDILFGITREQIHVLRSRVEAGNIDKPLEWEKDGPLAVYRAGIPERAAAPPPLPLPPVSEVEVQGQQAIADLRGAEQSGGFAKNAPERVDKLIKSLARPTEPESMARARLLSARFAVANDLNEAGKDGAGTADKITVGAGGKEGHPGVSGPEIPKVLEVPGAAELYVLMIQLAGLELKPIGTPDAVHPNHRPLGWEPGKYGEVSQIRGPGGAVVTDPEINRNASYDDVIGGIYGPRWMDNHGFTGPGWGADWVKDFRDEPGKKKFFMKLENDETMVDRFKVILGVVVAERIGIWPHGGPVPTPAERDKILSDERVVDAVSAAWGLILHSGVVPWVARWGEGHSHPMNHGAYYMVENLREWALRRAAQQNTDCGAIGDALRAQGFVRDSQVNRANAMAAANGIETLVPGKDILSSYLFRQGVWIQARIGGQVPSMFDILRDPARGANVWDRVPKASEFTNDMAVVEGTIRHGAAAELIDKVFRVPGSEKKPWELDTASPFAKEFEVKMEGYANKLGYFAANVSDRELEMWVQTKVLQVLVAQMGLAPSEGIHLMQDRLTVEEVIIGLEDSRIIRPKQAADANRGTPERAALGVKLLRQETVKFLRDHAAPISNQARDYLARNAYRIYTDKPFATWVNWIKSTAAGRSDAAGWGTKLAMWESVHRASYRVGNQLVEVELKNLVTGGRSKRS